MNWIRAYRIPILLMAIISIYSCTCEHNMKICSKQYGRGYVVNIIFDTADRMTPYLRFDNGDSLCVLFYEKVYNEIETHDYVIKDSGKLELVIINSKNDTSTFYPICGGKKYYKIKS